MAKAQLPAEVGDNVRIIATDVTGMILKINPDGSLLVLIDDEHLKDPDDESESDTTVVTPDQVILLVD